MTGVWMLIFQEDDAQRLCLGKQVLGSKDDGYQSYDGDWNR